jgi:hypothetical protein
MLANADLGDYDDDDDIIDNRAAAVGNPLQYNPIQMKLLESSNVDQKASFTASNPSTQNNNKN